MKKFTIYTVIFTACVAVLTLCAISLTGCDLAKPKNPMPPTPPAPTVPEPKVEEPVIEEPKVEEPVAETATETVQIEQGFTGKGQYGQGGGEKPMDIITVPVGTLFTTRERMFLMQLKHTEDLYKANNDNQMPKTHEEYMEKIIKEGGLTLPQLPDGQEYVYDPEDQQLKIRKPK